MPEKQIKSGLAEIIKCGITSDKNLFEFIEKNLKKILKLDKECLYKIIARAAEIKARVVEKDEKDNGERLVLNYGHSIGHVLEKRSNYTLLHGHAISIGMVLENRLAVEKKILDKKSAERIKKLFINAGLPVATMQKVTLKDLDKDKKKSGTNIRLALPISIGRYKIFEWTIK